MTTVGHSLTGAAIATLCIPRSHSRWTAAGFVAAFVVLANVPDLRLPGWGHSRYDISHSVFTNHGLILAGVALLLFMRASRRAIGGWPVVACGGVAVLSHLLLDSFYSHGRGVAVCWPVSHARLSLPLPWFSVLDEGWKLSAHALRVVSIETLFYGSLLAACVIARLLTSPRTTPSRPRQS